MGKFAAKLGLARAIQAVYNDSLRVWGLLEAVESLLQSGKIEFATHKEVVHRLWNHEMYVQPCKLLDSLCGGDAVFLKIGVVSEYFQH